jgi:hypothetical protein
MAEEERDRRAAVSRARRSAYFRAYYERHREAILEKNRRWYEEHQARAAERRRIRMAGRRRRTTRCVDCGVVLARAERCGRCRARYRYATEPEYRARRLASAERWRVRARPALPREGGTR